MQFLSLSEQLTRISQCLFFQNYSLYKQMLGFTKWSHLNSGTFVESWIFWTWIKCPSSLSIYRVILKLLFKQRLRPDFETLIVVSIFQALMWGENKLSVIVATNVIDKRSMFSLLGRLMMLDGKTLFSTQNLAFDSLSSAVPVIFMRLNCSLTFLK